MKRVGLVLLGVVVAAAFVATAATFASNDGTTLEHDSDEVTFAAGPGQEVSGQTDLDPGTTLHVRLTSTDDSQAFLLRNRTTVADDGSFTATFDMRDVAEGSTGNLTVRHDGTVLTSATVEVVTCDDDCEAETAASKDEPDEESSGTTVDRDGETLSLTAGAEQEITGESHLDAGTELQVRLQSTDASQPLLLREETSVTDDGSFAVTMDLSSVSEETNASLTVLHGSDELAQTAVTIEPCEVDCGDETSKSDGESAQRSEFGLEENVVTGRENETVAIRVTLADADHATLRIGDEDVAYQVTATAGDGNDDGRVVFLLDPPATRTESPRLFVRDADDSIAIENESNPDGTLPPADYDLSLYRGTSENGDADDIGTLVLRDS